MPALLHSISPSKLDPYADKFSGSLKGEATKSRKQRRTLKQIHGDRVALGFDGSYNRVAALRPASPWIFSSSSALTRSTAE